MNNRTVIFPGSFDPITIGHVDIIKRAMKLFDTIIIAIGENQNKKYMFEAEERSMMIKAVFQKNNQIQIIQYNDLTSRLCDEKNTHTIIRGIRNNQDFNYEQTLYFANNELDPRIDTLFLSSKKDHLFISSSIVKDIITHKGKLESFVPSEIIPYINQKFTS